MIRRVVSPDLALSDPSVNLAFFVGALALLAAFILGVWLYIQVTDGEETVSREWIAEQKKREWVAVAEANVTYVALNTTDGRRVPAGDNEAAAKLLATSLNMRGA
jgi:hypothetical protein